MLKVNTVLILLSFFMTPLLGQSEIEINGSLHITEADDSAISETVLVRDTNQYLSSANLGEIFAPEEPKPIPFAQGWVDYGADYQAGTYYKYANRVHFDGLIARSSGSIMDGDTIAILPAGYRPKSRMIAHCKQNDTPIRVNIEPDGAIWIVSGSNGGTWIDISGISFFRNDLQLGDHIEGGIVFYIATPAADLNGDGIVDRGLIAAEADLPAASWGCSLTDIQPAEGTSIGSGYTNTQAIVQECGQSGIAAELADDYIINGYSDWFLPSVDELQELNAVLGFYGTGENYNAANLQLSAVYWTSTDLNSLTFIAAAIDIDAGLVARVKDAPNPIRPIRVF